MNKLINLTMIVIFLLLCGCLRPSLVQKKPLPVPPDEISVDVNIQNASQIIYEDVGTAQVVVSQSDIDLVRQRTVGVKVRLAETIAETIPAVFKREVPAATDQLPSKTLSQEGGGQIAIDPRDMLGVKAFQKVFLFDLELPDQARLYYVGGRVYVRFDHGWEPLVWRWYRGTRQLFLRRFNV